jgi:hypothetical protein
MSRYRKDAENLPARNWVFSAKDPIEGHKLTADQLHAAWRFNNKIIELNCERRRRITALLQARFPKILEIEENLESIQAEIDTLRGAIKQRNAQLRRKTIPPEDRKRVDDLVVRRRALVAQLKEAKKAAYADASLKEALQTVEAEHLVAFKAIYNDKAWGLGPGTRESIRASRANDHKGAPPVFQHWTGDGYVGVQRVKPKTGTFTWADAKLCKDRCIRIQVLPLQPAPDVPLRIAARPTPEETVRLRELYLHEAAIIARSASTAVRRGHRDALLKEIATIEREHPPRGENDAAGQPQLLLRHPARERRWRLLKERVVTIERGLRFWPTPETRDEDAPLLGTLRAEIALLEETILRPAQAPKAAIPGKSRSRIPLAIAWLRIFSGPGRTPVWAKVPFYLRREPPPDTEVKRAYLHRIMVGRKECWQLRFVLARPSWDRDDVAVTGACGLDVRWRLTDEGLRVGTAVGDDGVVRTLTLPHEWIDAWKHTASLRSDRDIVFDRFRQTLQEWTKGHKHIISEWLRDELTNLHLWRNPERLGRVVWLWRVHRFAGDEAIYTLAEEWRKQDRHLHNYQDFSRQNVIRRRNWTYRVFARELASTYRQVTTLAIDRAKGKKRSTAEKDDVPPAVRAYRDLAACGTLVQFVKEAVDEARRVPPEAVSHCCHVCGQDDEFDTATEWVHTCSECGATWDLAENAARNLLNRDSEPVDESDDETEA